jgi:hypothetical protein
MITLCITCLVGVYFGFYYGFLVLIPVTLVAAVAGSAVHGEAISSILLTILAQAIGLQGGYMIGLTGRDVLSQFVARHAEPGTSSFPGDCGAIFAWKLTRLTFYFLAFVRDRADLATACARGSAK